MIYSCIGVLRGLNRHAERSLNPRAKTQKRVGRQREPTAQKSPPLTKNSDGPYAIDSPPSHKGHRYRAVRGPANRRLASFPFDARAFAGADEIG